MHPVWKFFKVYLRQDFYNIVICKLCDAVVHHRPAVVMGLTLADNGGFKHLRYTHLQRAWGFIRALVAGCTLPKRPIGLPSAVRYSIFPFKT